MPNNKINYNNIDKIIWNICNILRGVISQDAYKDIILPILVLKFISDLSKKKFSESVANYNDTPEFLNIRIKNHSSTSFGHLNFWYLYENRHELGNDERINQALNSLAKTYDLHFNSISFDKVNLKSKNQINNLYCHLLESLSKIDFNLFPSNKDSMRYVGNFFEYLIHQFAVNSGNGTSEFYTLPEVSDLLVNILEPIKDDQICDPACGSGSLLIKCGALIQDKFNSEDYFLFGQEAISSTCTLAKLNMIMHGEDNHRIEDGDTIHNPLLTDVKGRELLKFDVVISNPPFGLNYWNFENANNDYYGRFHRGAPPRTKIEYAFISHMIETLKPKTGRMGIIVPHGVLFRTSREGVIRQKLIEENLLDTVIGLPEKLFFGTIMPAAILIFKKQKNDNSVLFIDASQKFNTINNQNNITSDNIKKIINTFKSRENIEEYSYLASFDEIKENNFNLNISLYIDPFKDKVDIDLVEVNSEQTKLQKELKNIGIEMDGFLKEMGYGC